MTAVAERPNPAVNLTRHDCRLCKPSLRQLYYLRGPGLQGLHPRAGHLYR